MGWGPLASTSLGAVIGIASTLATDQMRTRRGREDKDEAARRQLYGDYLAALARTRNHLRMAARSAGLDSGERGRRAVEAFFEGNAYELRYQIAIVAPAEVVEASTNAFRSLRDLRDLVEAGALHTDQSHVDARERWELLLAELRMSMRRDLGQPVLQPARPLFAGRLVARPHGPHRTAGPERSEGPGPPGGGRSPPLGDPSTLERSGRVGPAKPGRPRGARSR